MQPNNEQPNITYYDKGAKNEMNMVHCFHTFTGVKYFSLSPDIFRKAFIHPSDSLNN